MCSMHKNSRQPSPELLRIIQKAVAESAAAFFVWTFKLRTNLGQVYFFFLPHESRSVIVRLKISFSGVDSRSGMK